MRLNDSGYNALHEREGLRLKPYLDTKGIPTIAIGNTFYLDGRKVTMNDKPLTIREAYKLGRIVSDNFAKDVFKLLKKEVNQNQFNALVSLAYNIGINGFAKSTVLKRVNINPNDPTIKSAFMMWTKNKELIGRRKSEAEQYFTKP
jgi:lysozyme